MQVDHRNTIQCIEIAGLTRADFASQFCEPGPDASVSVRRTQQQVPKASAEHWTLARLRPAEPSKH